MDNARYVSLLDSEQMLAPATTVTATYYTAPHGKQPHTEDSTLCASFASEDIASAIPPAQPLLSVSSSVIVEAEEEQEQHTTDASDWGLSCISLLDWMGYATTCAWLSVDPERRMLALLLRREPVIAEYSRGILAVSSSCAIAKRGIDVSLFDKHAALLSFCHNNLQHAYGALREARVSAHRFLCSDDDTLTPQACATHSAELIERYAREHAIERTVAYNACSAVCVDGDMLRECRTPALNDIMRAFRVSTAWHRALSLCVVLARDDTGRRLVVSSAAFVSLDHYRQCADSVPVLARELLHDRARRHRCAECALCPAVSVLRSFWPGTAPPALSITTNSCALASCDTSTSIAEYERDWNNPRAIHTELTHSAGPLGMRHAVLWFFGGINDPLSVLLETAEALCRDDGTLVDALCLIQDTIVLDVQSLSKLASSHADAIRETHISVSLARRQLYSFRLGAINTSCAKTFAAVKPT